MTERLSDLLSENPTLRPMDLVKGTGCSAGFAAKVHKAYFEKHPHLAPPIPKTATQQVYELLAENPTLRVADLSRLVGCDRALAGRARQIYLERHPEQEAEARKAKQPTARERVCALLDEDQSLTPSQLAALVGCSIRSAREYRNTKYGAPPVPKGNKMEQCIRALLAENPEYTPSQLQQRAGYSSGHVRKLLARIHAESASSVEEETGGRECFKQVNHETV